ncbi:hypothetical protein F4604DRAFT_1693137 [Suillus subluteus]|nr:hypothetical protein F4604DRAFT_1693137 [Suillus subluteus]
MWLFDGGDGDLEGGTIFGSTREVWAGLAALLSLPLLISLLLHPNRHALAIRAHVPKTVHPWVTPLENPASEVASRLWLLLVVVMRKGCRSRVVENADESENKIKLGSLHKVDSTHRIFDLLAPSRVTGPSHLSSQTLINLAHGRVQTGYLQPVRHAEAFSNVGVEVLERWVIQRRVVEAKT